MARKTQDQLFPTPPEMEATAKKARAAEQMRLRLPALYEAARDAVNGYCRSRDAGLILQAEDALGKWLDALLQGIEPKGNYDDALPDDFVWVLMAFLRALEYDRSLESFLMHNISTDRVSPGCVVFWAQWPGHIPDYDKTPYVLVMRVAD